ncbi:MAG: quinohemoprotein amine dehydrogenase subunit alpha [Planctomycetota bacterium]|nr:quinohemoprotein amine dehydrogenase subunit alpha [Planctomycetota bacterium]
MRSTSHDIGSVVLKSLVLCFFAIGIGYSLWLPQQGASDPPVAPNDPQQVTDAPGSANSLAFASADVKAPALPPAAADYYRHLAESKSATTQDPQQPPAPDQDPPDPQPAPAVEAQDPAEQPQVRPGRRGAGERQGRRGNRQGRRGRPAADPAAQDAATSDAGESADQVEGDSPASGDEETGDRSGEGRGGRSRGDRSEASEKKKPREGIPVRHPLIEERCVVCHARDDEGKMSRISYMRKTPEAWEISIKRMARLYFVSLTPEEAKEVVRYLSEEHGLSRNEARAAMYESERRVHWSEEDRDEALRETCADCHTLGRVLSERRDEQEWKLLKATHLALYPLVDFQSFRGRSSGGRGRGGGSSESESEGGPPSRGSRGQDRADQVLATLAKEQGLFSEEWRNWNQEKREVPLEGRWIVFGHEVGRGPIRGTLDLKRISTGEYESQWRWLRANGRTVVRQGTGLFYAGHSWRGRSESTAPGESGQLKEVMLLDESWTRMEGRLFTGEYNELGIEVQLLRAGDTPTILGVLGGELAVPSEGNRIEVIGCGFPEELEPGDFHLGKGITVLGVERHDATRVSLLAEVEADLPLGDRAIDFRIHQGPRAITLYDTIDGIRIRPNPGFSRIGGKMRPKQLERFEAVAFTRGPDGIPYNEDDVELMTVPVKWHLEEFPIRPGDDDIQFVGDLDEDTGVFTPAIDGPNPDRRFNANNIGDVYVVATCTMTVPERKEVKEETEEDEGDGSNGDSEEDSSEGSEPNAGEDSEDSTVEDAKKQIVAADEPPKMVEKEFRARGHLLVTVPIYVKWDQYEWNQR